MMNVRTLASRLAVVALFFVLATPLSATVYTAHTSGDFHTNTNYSPVPNGAFTSADDIVVNPGVVLTLTTAGTTTLKSVTLSSGAGGAAIHVNTGATLALTGTNGNGVSLELGDPGVAVNEIVVNGGGTLTVSNGASLYGSTSGFSKLRSTGGAIQVNSIAFLGTKPANAVIDLSSGSGTFNLTFGNLPGGGTILPGTNSTFELSGSQTIQTFGGYTFHHLKINKSAGSSAQLTSAIDVNGDFYVTSGAFDMNAFNATVDGNIFGSGAINMSAGGILSVGNNFNNTGTFTPGTGTVIYTGGVGQNVKATTYNQLEFSGTNTNGLLLGAVTAAKLVVPANSYVSLGGHNMTVTGDATVHGSISTSGGTLTFTGATGSITGSGIIGPNTTMSSRAINGSPVLRFLGNVTISSGATVTNNGTVDIDNSLEGADSVATWINSASSSLTVGGNVFSISGVLSASATGNSVTYDGGNQALYGQTNYHHLTLGSTIPASKTYTSSSLTINGDFTVKGQSIFTASSNITVGGTLSITETAVFHAGSNTITVAGNWNRTATFNANTSTVHFNGTAAQSISASPFWSVSFSNGGAKTLAGAISAGDDFTINAGATVNAGSFAHTVGGTWTNSGTFNAGSSHVTFNPSGSLITVDPTSFYKLSVSTTSGGGISLTGNVSVANEFTLSVGTVQLNTYELYVAGTSTIASSTTFSIGSGTFRFDGNVIADGTVSTGSTGTVKPMGNAVQAWAGSTAPTVANLWVNKTGGSFNPDVVFTVTATLTLDGIMSPSSGAIVALASTGSLVRNSGWVDGRVRRTFNGAATLLYPTGTASGYAPMTVTSAAAGTLDVDITPTAHPNNTGGGSNQLQAYWSLYNTSLTGSVSLSFQWTAAMENGTPGNYVIGRYNAGSWSQPGGTVGTQTASISGVSSFTGDWTVGDQTALGGTLHFVLSGPATATAGGTVTVTITAKDNLNNTATGYAGDKTLVFSGASTAPNGTSHPAATDKTSTFVQFGSNTTVTFTGGVASANLKLYAAETAFIDVSDSSGIETQTAYNVVIDPAAASKLNIGSIDFLSSPYANAPFDVNVESLDQYDNRAPVTANTDVQLTLAACGGCTGTLGGTTTTTIYPGSDNDVIFGAKYSAAQSNVVLTVQRTAGDILTSANSSPMIFAAQVSGIAVTSSADSGPGTLRTALERNNNGECTAPCNITFNISPSGAHEIVLAEDLPAVEQPAIIDATTQPGFTGAPIIALDGGAASNGFYVPVDGTTIKGFILHTFSGAGIEFSWVNGGVVQNCWIGTDLTGNAGAGNWVGLSLWNSDGIVIGGSGANEGNVISGNFNGGIELTGDSGSNTIAGNRIGTNAAGTIAIANDIGIAFYNGAANNVIGGSTAAHRNIISGNDLAGIYFQGAPPAQLEGPSAQGNDVDAQLVFSSFVNANTIQNNYIGTNASGTAAVPNSFGVYLDGSCTANSIGQTGNGNLISGNTSSGVIISGASNNDNFIRANLIGLAADGVSALGNGGDGIEFVVGSRSEVGGIGGGDGNTIAHNTGNGVTVKTGEDVMVVGNSIHSNGGSGIDLGDDGADTQDDGLGDADNGANGKQNYPLIGSAQITNGNLQVAVTMNSSSTQTLTNSMRVQIFEADSMASGEGRFTLGTQCIGGNVLSTTITVPVGSVVAGDAIVATATSYTDGGCTNVNYGTSEFSPAVAAANCTPPTASITASGPTTFCNGGSVTLTASTGTSYLWSNGATSQSITVSTSGNYSVTVTNASGCSATSAATTVTVNPIPTATITANGPTTFCTGGSVTLTANAGTAYLWSTGATTQSITVSASGSYTVKVTQNGCTSPNSSPVNVTVNSAPPASISASGPTTFCAGGSVTLTANTADSYLWSTGATTQSITVTASGNYTVQVVNNGCMSAASAPMTVTVTPAPAATITASGPTTFCSGGSVTLTASTGDSYLWSTGANTQSITVSASGNYTVQVTNNGCSATSAPKTVTVNPAPTATITASGPTTFCSGGSVTLTASIGDSYLWSNGATTQSITVTTGGNYTVQVTNNGCSTTSAPTSVTVTPAPAATITASGPTSFCTGGSVTLTASVGDSYLWSNGATTQSINVTTGGNYSVTVTNNGCNATSAPTTVTVTPAPASTITASGPTTFCAGGNVTLTASAGTSWLWSNGETTQSIVVTTSGSYTVTVTNNGCNATSAPMVVTVNPAPDATISGPTSTCTGVAVTLTAGNGSSWLWSNGATTQSITVTPTANETYTVTVSNGSCSATDSHTVSVSATPTATVTAPASVCANSTGNTASVAAQSGATYAWTITGGTITSGATSNAITFNAGPSGNVVLGVTVQKNSCTSTGNVTIPVTAGLSPSISGPSTACPSAPFTLDAGSGYASYLWSNGATTQTITVTQSAATQTYSVTVASGGCSATASKTVTLSSPPAPFMNAPEQVDPLSTGHTASVPAGGTGYAWTITNGTITAGQGTNAITFNAGPSGSVGLSVTFNSGSCPVTVTGSVSIGVAEADFAITKSGPSTVLAGGTIVYTINVTNNGPSAATSIEIVDELPAGVTLVGVQSGFRCTTVGNAVYCNGSGFLGTLAPIVITVTAPQQAATLTNVARVTANLPDPNPSNNSASVVTTVTSPSCGTPASPIMISPNDGASGLTSPVTFSWTAVPQAIGYRLWASVNGGAPQQLGQTDGAISLTTAAPAGSLTVFVEALFANNCPSSRSADLRISVNAPEGCGSRATATPVSPANGSTVTSSLVTFQWSPAANADGYRVWASIDGAAPAVIGETVGETTVAATLARGTIEWWVEALYDGCASTESQRVRFTIPPAQQCGTERPTLVAPSAGASVPAGLVSFSWTAVPSAVAYELWLAQDNGSPVLARSVAAPATSVQHEVPAGALLWFVRVVVDRCPSGDSDTQRFTATQPVSCTTNVRPIAEIPVDRARVSSPVTFSWSEAKGATKYELFVAHGNQTAQLVATITQTSVSGIELANGRKRWFVRAHFAQGCPVLDSSEQDLEVVPQPAACAPLGEPVLSAPGQISSGAPFSILWSAVPGATTYQLELANDASFTNAESVSTTSTSHDLVRTNNGAAPLAVFVRVRAVDTRCNPAATGAYGTAAIFILPPTSGEAAASAGETSFITLPLILGAELAGQSFTATPTQPWLTVTPSSGTIPAGGLTLTVRADTSLLPLGTSMGGVTVTTTGATSGRLGASSSSTTTPVSVSIVTPVSPTPKNTPPPDALIIPAVAHADGINAKFQSDVRVSNTSPRLMKYQLTFTPSGASGMSQGKQTTFSIDPGRTIALDDILKTWFGTGNTSVTGVLEIRPLTQTTTSTSSSAVSGLANLTTFASSRTYNLTPNGTFGQFIPAIPYANFVSKGTGANSNSILSLQQIAHSDRFRTNLGFVEGSGQAATLMVTVYGSNGAKVTSFPVNLNGGQHLQMNSFLAQQGITSLSDGRVEVQVTSSTGKVTAYASVLDNDTADPLLVSPVALSEQGHTKWVVPGVADLANGLANWQTDMRIFNAGTNSVEATLSFHSQRGGEPIVKTLTIPPGQVRELDRTLASLFGATNDGGAVHIATASSERLIATARTYNQTSNGTFGQFISAVTIHDAVGVGSRPLQLLQLEESERYRSNIGFAEVSGKEVTLEVGVVPPDGKTSAFIEVTLAPNEFRQLNSLLASAGLRNAHNARVTVRAISGTGRAAAYASVVDMETQDPTYVPAQ